MTILHEFIEHPTKVVEVRIPDDLLDSPVDIYILRAGMHVVIESDQIVVDDLSIMSKAREIAPKNGWPAGFLDRMFGSMPDFPDVEEFLSDPDER